MALNINKINSPIVYKTKNIQKEKIQPQKKISSLEVDMLELSSEEILKVNTDSEYVDNTEKVETIKRLIEEGCYSVDSRKIAEKMVQNMRG